MLNMQTFAHLCLINNIVVGFVDRRTVHSKFVDVILSKRFDKTQLWQIFMRKTPSKCKSFQFSVCRAFCDKKSLAD